MSKYVQRCLGCRRVCGKTSFRVTHRGQRSEICRWCETEASNAAKNANALRASMAPLLREQATLVSRLARVRSQIRAKEAELLAETQRVAS